MTGAAYTHPCHQTHPPRPGATPTPSAPQTAPLAPKTPPTHARTHALRQDGWSGLILAAQNGHEAVVRLLLERGAEVDKASQVGVAWPSTRMPLDGLGVHCATRVDACPPPAPPWHPSRPGWRKVCQLSMPFVLYI